MNGMLVNICTTERNEPWMLRTFGMDYVSSPRIGYAYIDGWVYKKRKSSALAMDLRLLCTNPLVCGNNVDRYYFR